MIGMIGSLVVSVVKAGIGYFERRQKLKNAVTENNIRLARSRETHNQTWELRQLMNTGWKDEILFFGIVGMYVYSAIDPDGAHKVFQNWDTIPEWFRTITSWMVAGVLGVKKLGDYLPALVAGVRNAVSKGE